jgi:plasmid stability protein
MLADMGSILIRDVPDEVRAELAARAARNGQSMQEFLRATLVEMTAKPSPEEWVRRVERRLAAFEGPGPTAEEIVTEIRALRDGR